MDIETTLNQLYNTLLTIETKGDATLKMAACIDALQKVLTDNFRDIILVQLNSASSPEYFEKTFGWKRGKYWAIKYSCGFYTREQLVNIFRFLCGIQFGDIPEDKLVSYLITHIISM